MTRTGQIVKPYLEPVHVPLLIVAEAALLGPSLRDYRQLVVPDQLPHVGGGRLRAGRAPRLLAQGHLGPQLVVEVQGGGLLGRGQPAGGEAAVARGSDALKKMSGGVGNYNRGDATMRVSKLGTYLILAHGVGSGDATVVRPLPRGQIKAGQHQ